ncbi:O-succinylbenzoate synthase [Cutibacterium acnes JCM 18920]|nr:O-succinylbenzoate synthase [Cutibacterium acnes JCM 18920]
MLADRGIDRMLAFAVPLTVRFRGIEVREGTLLHGPEGWGEWSPFWDYDPVESASWLRAGIEGATRRYPWRDEIGCRSMSRFPSSTRIVPGRWLPNRPV